MAYGPSWTRESHRVHASKRVKHDLTHEGAKVYSSCLFAERFRLHIRVWHAYRAKGDGNWISQAVDYRVWTCPSFVYRPIFYRKQMLSRARHMRALLFEVSSVLRWKGRRVNSSVYAIVDHLDTTVLLKHLLPAILFFYLIYIRLYIYNS